MRNPTTKKGRPGRYRDRVLDASEKELEGRSAADIFALVLDATRLNRTEVGAC